MARGRPQPDVSPRRATRGKAQSAAVASAGSLDPAQLWRSLVRHSPDRIVLLDRSGRILYTNHTGSFDSVELVVGSRFDALAANPVRATLRRTLTQLFREGGGQPAHFEIPVVGTSALRWWDGHALPVVERGKVAAVLLVCRDVTERRHTEEALRIQEAQLAEAQGLAHIGSWERNLNDETATWSEELYRIFGLTQSTNLVGRARFYELIHPDDRQRVKQAIEHGVLDIRSSGLTDPDAVPEPPDEPITQSGDLWVLGSHRLLCGDASKEADVDRLLAGEPLG